MKNMLKLSKWKDEENISLQAWLWIQKIIVEITNISCKRQVVASSCKLIGCKNPIIF
jgi:hypothetical protein